jgi:poly(ADP-ribose) glycohydrolase
MINTELIAGMLFLPSMAENEAIEIIGAERFSSYTG